LTHALRKGLNEDLARKRLLHLGAEVRDLSGAAAEPKRRSKALAGTRQRPIRQQARSEAAATGQRQKRRAAANQLGGARLRTPDAMELAALACRMRIFG
jgi:hypothetical protein